MVCEACGGRLKTLTNNISFEWSGISVFVIGVRDAIGCPICQTIIELPKEVENQIKECVAEKEKEGGVPYLTINLLG